MCLFFMASMHFLYGNSSNISIYIWIKLSVSFACHLDVIWDLRWPMTPKKIAHVKLKNLGRVFLTFKKINMGSLVSFSITWRTKRCRNWLVGTWELDYIYWALIAWYWSRVVHDLSHELCILESDMWCPNYCPCPCLKGSKYLAI